MYQCKQQSVAHKVIRVLLLILLYIVDILQIKNEIQMSIIAPLILMYKCK